MKRFASFLVITCLLFVELVLPMPTRAADVNLLSNADLSEVDGSGAPIDFIADSWGSHTPTLSFNQGTPPYLHTAIDNYVDGDAKWYHVAVSVEPGKQYGYVDNYRSDVVTHYWAQFWDVNNQPTYQWLGQATAAAEWNRHEVLFTVPADKVRVAVFHVLNSNGYLDTNDFVLRDTTPTSCDPKVVNGIVNGDFEVSCNGGFSAAAWHTAVYGVVDAQFTYDVDEYDGSRNVSVTIGGGSPDGEAGWYTAPFGIAGGSRMQLEFWHVSSTYVYAYVEFMMSDGTYAYAPLTSVPASGEVWSQYQDIFLVPQGAVTAAVHIATSAPGEVRIDDVSLGALPAYANNRFNRPLVSINFDDGWSGTYTQGLEVMDQFGFKGTFFVNAASLDTTSFMTSAQVISLVNAGHEIGSHSYYHDNMVELNPEDLWYEIVQNKLELEQLTGKDITNFATPYSSFNSNVLDAIMDVHASHRDTSGALNHKYNFNYRQIHAKVITEHTTVAEIINLLTQAKNENAWLILAFHDVGNSAEGGEGFSVTKEMLRQYLQAVQNSGIAVVTNQAALNEIAPQL